MVPYAEKWQNSPHAFPQNALSLLRRWIRFLNLGEELVALVGISIWQLGSLCESSDRFDWLDIFVIPNLGLDRHNVRLMILTKAFNAANTGGPRYGVKVEKD